MNPPLLQIIQRFAADYPHFCETAAALDWSEHKPDFRSYRPDWHRTLSFCYLHFPESFMTLQPESAAAQALLTNLSFREEWPRDFWEIPEAERRRCLTEGAELYRGIFRADEITGVSFADAAEIIRSYTGDSAPLTVDAKEILSLCLKADGMETVQLYCGGFCPEWTWISVQRNEMLVTEFAVGD